jgi:hypothetical protein
VQGGGDPSKAGPGNERDKRGGQPVVHAHRADAYHGPSAAAPKETGEGQEKEATASREEKSCPVERAPPGGGSGKWDAYGERSGFIAAGRIAHALGPLLGEAASHTRPCRAVKPS